MTWRFGLQYDATDETIQRFYQRRADRTKLARGVEIESDSYCTLDERHLVASSIQEYWKCCLASMRGKYQLPLSCTAAWSQ